MSNETVEILGTKYTIATTDCIFLFCCKLTEIPKEVFSLINLTQLHLTNNSLTEIPKEISNLKKLEKLYISINNIKTVPYELLQLTHLQVIGISQNPLEFNVSSDDNNLKEVVEYLQNKADKEKNSNAELVIKSFISNHVIPKFYDLESNFMDLTI